ncbi:MAG: NifB/NifX family molybdenum-iron cluster-binding protein [Bacteroidaceae bacterium]|nr:NifB/NifX family molybdenum-iron cluster-binding protein [Bacteroidaceae bacterium]
MRTKIAVPTANGTVCAHFGHCETFYFATIENNAIINEEFITPPAHEPGLYPKWIKEQGATMVITGGMGQKAQTLFDQEEVKYVVGAPSIEPKQVVVHFLSGQLATTANSCSH